MRKSFKYRIEANQQTIQQANYWLDLCRNLYNNSLADRIQVYKATGKSLSYYRQKKLLPYLKQQNPEYKQVNSQTLQDVIERLDKAYKAFFRRVKNGDEPGFPRFKGENRYDSFTLKGSGWKLNSKYLTIRNIGKFKLRLSQPIEGDVKTIIISRTSSGKWFASFSCDNVADKPLPKTGKTVGIDVGCKEFLTTSDGIHIGNPHFLNKSCDILKMRQQRLSRRKKGSNHRNKARILVAKAYEKIANQRRDFHFKVANWLIMENDIICIEKMDAWNTEYHVLNRSMRDAAWFEFFNILRFKAEEAGREVIEVPAKDTSQICSRCGARVEKDLSVRVHSCPQCGLVIDRDTNSAKLIKGLGQSLQASLALKA